MVSVTLTPKGPELLECVAPKHTADIQALMFAPLSASEVSTLASLLTKISAPLSAHPFVTQPMRKK
jgi:DNA-binding MarR family transcriptional regulator